ncbi:MULTISPECIES: hypothetical protein [Pseudomonas]|uniref:hypothetical protein n=1 Tax=Pseudomonas TaxID=286 RepID=UPI000FA2437A|nr:hypothetical protein [Pseudomonas sp. C2B4]NUU34350.1 hypothetical protein [Pseudomonas sp. C2B4]
MIPPLAAPGHLQYERQLIKKFVGAYPLGLGLAAALGGRLERRQFAPILLLHLPVEFSEQINIDASDD